MKQLHIISNLFVDGLKLIKKISTTVQWMLNLHFDKNVPVTKSSLILLAKLIEILKAVYLTFNKNLEALLYLITMISQHILHKALSIIFTMKVSLGNNCTNFKARGKSQAKFCRTILCKKSPTKNTN